MEKFETYLKYIRKYPSLQNCELIVDEWGPPLKHPSGHNRTGATAICKIVDLLSDLQAKEKFSLGPIVFWGLPSGDADNTLGFDVPAGSYNHGLSYSCRNVIIKKPVWIAYELLKNLGDRKISVTGCKPGDLVGCLATINSTNNAIAVLVYNTPAKEGGALDANVQIVVNNIPFKKASYRHYRIDAEHSSTYDLWKQSGSPKWTGLTQEQVEQLVAKGKAELLQPAKELDISRQTYQESFMLPVDAVSLIVLDGTK